MLPSSNDIKKEKLKDILLGLHWAATTGNVGLVKFALDHGVPIDSVVNGFVPLQLACISDSNIAAVQYLIDRGADMNIQNWSKKYSVDKTQAVQGATGSTALHVACANGCVKIVDLLIRNNARVDVKDKYGSTPLDVAQAKHETEIIHLLKSAKIKQRKDPHHHNNNHHHHQKNKQTHRRSLSSSHDDVQYLQPQTQLSETQSRKSVEIMTHKRTPSNDKQGNRIRRPSLPSIFEGRQHTTTTTTTAIPSTITMTPSTDNSGGTYLEVLAVQRRSFSAGMHRPSSSSLSGNEDNSSSNTHSCPATPRSSIEQVLSGKRSHASSLSVPGVASSSSPRSSSESSRIKLSSSPSTSLLYAPAGSTDYAMTADGKPDWYAYGVVNSYHDENYLLSLERRAYNLGCNEDGGLERNSQESTRKSFEKDSSHHRRLSNATDDGISSNMNTQQDNKSAAKARSNSADAVGVLNGHPLRKTALKNAMAAQSSAVSSLSTNESTSLSADDAFGDDEGDEEEDEEEYEVSDEEEEENTTEEDQYQSESLPRPSVVLDYGPESDSVRYQFKHQQIRRNSTDNNPVTEVKKSWFSVLGKEGRQSFDTIQRRSLDLRPNLDHLAHFVAKKVSGKEEESSDEDLQQQQQQQQKRNSGFFSRWAPTWSKK